MHTYCRNLLTVSQIDSGHWMAQEKPFEVNCHLVEWLVDNEPNHWPQHYK